MRLFTTICIAMALLLMSAEWSLSQTLVRHQQPAVIELDQPVTLEFMADQLSSDQVVEALLFVRPSDRSSFSENESRFLAGQTDFELLISNPSITSIEYYLVLRLRDGSEIHYPDVPSGETPYEINVIPQVQEDLPSAGFIDYTILSPLPGRGLENDDLLIALALFYDDDIAGLGRFGLRINGEDVTDQADISSYLIKYQPTEPPSGQKNIQVTYEQDDTVYQVAAWSFTIISGEPIQFGEFQPERDRRLPTGNVELSARNQEIAGFNNDALSGRLNLSGQEGNFHYHLRSYLTSQETSRLQPQNRYNANFRYGNRVQLELGDFHPYLSDMTISGRRVRGIHTAINLLNENVEASFLRGNLNRSVPNHYQPLAVQEIEFNGVVVDTLFTLGFDEGGRGTFNQQITAGRIAFGRENRFQIAFQGAKIQDDTTSINLIRDYNDITHLNPDLTSGLNQDHLQNLENSPNQIQIAGNNPNPRGNLMAGSEIRLSLDDQRIRFRSETGVSMLNNNISGGAFDQQRAEELGVILDPDLESLFSRFSRFIIINEQMNVLPFRYTENESGDLEVDPFFPTSILANESRLNLNYFDHNLQISYRWVGPNYQSLANSTVRRDVAGFGITDRFRLLNNRLYVTLGYESLRDNLRNNRDATLRTTSLRSNLSWYPVNPNLPRVSLTTRYRKRDNNLNRFNPFVTDLNPELGNAAMRNFNIVDGDTLTSPLPQLRETFTISSSVSQNFELLSADHQLSFSYGLTNTNDRRFEFGDAVSHNISINLRSRLDDVNIPVRTRLGYNFTDSESVSGLSQVRIDGMNIGVESLFFDRQLSLTTDLIFTRNRFSSLPLEIDDNDNPDSSFDNFFRAGDPSELNLRHTNSFVIRLGAQYDFFTNHALMGSLNYTNNRDPLGSLASLANDRILEFRYLFRF